MQGPRGLGGVAATAGNELRYRTRDRAQVTWFIIVGLVAYAYIFTHNVRNSFLLVPRVNFGTINVFE